MTYDPAKNSSESYREAIAAKRAKLLMERIPTAKRVVCIGDTDLILGDCLEVMPHLEKVDAVVTDPPYGMSHNTNFQRFTGGNGRRGIGRIHKPIIGDDRPFNPAPFIQYPCVLFGANHYWSKLPTGAVLVWIKRNDDALNTFLSDGEIAYLSKGTGVYAYKEVIAGSKKACEAGLDPYGPSAHPTQKPIGLMKWCLGFLPDAHTILDPFMGSGTTGVACVKLGRRFIGIELDEGYFNIAVERVRKAYAQPDLFLSQPKAPEPKQEPLL